MDALVNFLFEVGMLKRTPRTGYQFLGSGGESVAEHSFRTAVIGYLLSSGENGADPLKTVLMCLFHDLHEARTGDHNYVNKRYVAVDEERAVKDLARDLPFGEEIITLTEEFNHSQSLEAMIARDADQLDLILELKQQLDLGNKYANEWLSYAVKRLQTESARGLARSILNTDSADWWFDKDTDWVNGPSNHHGAPEE
ncbi:MAG: HD domain-containing protein [Deltaproteobacteria bacterium]|nr:HD domain-containing protein [Deltaproteobacteria bacterium]MBW2015615.1 HD domain-containing protein [Deltaproteobacteria bacterium]MBW2128114.1 HD domain-containing protein [Deltaproteobacteria bacterium]MBW2303025.1 HD domain-containing protein [Deltaproteobacteria bacterium]